MTEKTAGEDPARIRLTVSGRVQGVGYRYSACAEAQRLGLRGWVRNLPDGRVEVEAEGEPRQTAALRDWCRRGPPMARVDRITEESLTPLETETGFRVGY